MNKIIGFGHKKRVGKDYACTLLAKKLTLAGHSCNKVAFSDSLYDCCHRTIPGMYTKDTYEKKPELKDEIHPLVGKTHRQILIEVGNKLREVWPEIWIYNTIRQANDRSVLLISDVRYPNEVEAIRALGGIVVKIDRDCIEPTDDVADCALDGFEDWDHIIKNNSSSQFLADSVGHIASLYLEKFNAG